jgi:hypothetical protein
LELLKHKFAHSLQNEQLPVGGCVPHFTNIGDGTS